METNFKAVHTSKDLIISAIVILAGAGLYFLNSALGIIIAVCGVLMLLVFKMGYKKDGDGPVLSKKALDVAVSCHQSIKDFLLGISSNLEIKDAKQGGAIRLEVYYNEEQKIAYVQLYDFSNYSYERAMDMVELRSDRAELLISKLF